MGVKNFYISMQGDYVEFFNGDSLRVNNKVYYKSLKLYTSGKKDSTFYRNENGSLFSYDQDKKDEYLQLSSNTTPGYSWVDQDKLWRYTVIDTTSSLSTPYCSFTNLLNLKAEPMGKEKKEYSAYYNLLYKRGIGLVGVNIEGRGYSFRTIDKSGIEETPHVFPGCETLKSAEEISACTSEKVNGFISRNFQYTGKVTKGRLILSFEISENGDVENVSVFKAIPNGEKQTEEAIRIVKLLKFIPAKINGKPLKTSLAQPILF